MKRTLLSLLVLLALSSSLYASPYVPPKTYAPLDPVLSSDRNTENTRLAASINNIDPATQINDSSITSAQIAPGGISLNNLSANIAFVVVGTVTQYAGVNVTDTLISAGWLPCTGATASKTTYPALWALIGTTYGPATGTTFTLPDFRGRMAVGANPAVVTALVTEDTRSIRTVGDTGGVENHTLTSSEMPYHAHNTDAGAGASPTGLTAAGNGGLAGPITGYAGASAAHISMQPFIVMNYIIYAGRP
jgi:microcystin-dependent protein